jgi:hypothetical protein
MRKYRNGLKIYTNRRRETLNQGAVSHCQQVKKTMRAFLALRAKNRGAERSSRSTAPIFFAASRQKRISASIQVAWASSNFTK